MSEAFGFFYALMCLKNGDLSRCYMEFPTEPRDVVFALFEELKVSAAFAGAMAEWLGFPEGEIERFSAELLSRCCGNAEILFSCRIEKKCHIALLNIAFDKLNPPGECRCRQLKKIYRRYSADVKCALIVSTRAVQSYHFGDHWCRVFSCDMLRDYFLSDGSPRGEFIGDMLSDIRRGFSNGCPDIVLM